MRYAKIKSIKSEVKKQELYNLAVSENENYFANGIAVHNCRCVLIPITSDEEWEESPPLPATLRPDAGFEKPGM